MGFNLDFKVEDNLTKSQKKQLRDQFLKHFKKEEGDLSVLRGFYLVNPLDDTINYIGYMNYPILAELQK